MQTLGIKCRHKEQTQTGRCFKSRKKQSRERSEGKPGRLNARPREEIR
jgi:hypothetical protein